MASRTTIETLGNHRVLRLIDDDSGASAAILPGYGFNLFDLQLPISGEVRPVVAADPTFAESPSKPARSGFPLLFPFPNRIRDARFDFEGRTYELVPNKPPHAIHGFALDAAWDVIEHGGGPSGASVLGRFEIAKNAPDSLARWPANGVLEVRYTLSGRSLTLEATVSNPSDAPLPFGFGVHSYFHLPFDPDGDRARAKVIIPANEEWVTEGGIPTGERRAVSGRTDFRQGRAMAGLEADDVLTALDHGADGLGMCRLVEESLGAELRLTFDRAFREIVVFTPPGPGGVVAVEPYTQTTDAVHLEPRGIDAGLRVLPPGGSSSMRLAVTTFG